MRDKWIINGEHGYRLNPAGAALKAFQRAFPDQDCRPLAKLAGSDWQREYAADTAIAVGCLELCCESSIDFYAAWDRLAGVSRRQAYRALAVFPYHLESSKIVRAPGDWKAANGLWLGTSLFLLNREYELGLSKQLRASAWRNAEAYANLSELRYMLIRSLSEELDHDNYKLFEMKPSAIWLICEGAICLRQSRVIETSNRQDYETQKQYIDGFELRVREREELSTRKMESAQDGFNNLDMYIDGLAAELASENPDFDKQRFVPYISAQRRWNREKKKLRLLNPKKRPGPALGSKRRREVC